jgi:tetratricopeptide (TPR) repeat protein
MTLAVSFSDPETSFRPAHELGQLGEASATENLQAARHALVEHQWERAAALAALASARLPDSAEAALTVGMARFRAHEPAAAIAPFTRAAALAPTSATARFDLGSALYQSGRFGEAAARYLEAAARDDKLAPLALLDAGMAALDAGQPERALPHLQAAEKAARAAGQAPVADEARAAVESFAHRSKSGATPELQRLTRAGTEALRQRHYRDAVGHYRRALDLAIAEGANAADRAELEYDLGLALYRANDIVAAARSLANAVELAPREAEFHYLLGLAHFDAGADRDTKLALEKAVALGLPDAEARRAADILRALAETRRGEASRFYLELRTAGGLDTNVPQSGVIITATRTSGDATVAPFLESNLDFFWRVAGTARNGFVAEYRFGQLAYLSDELDLYSLQEHDLTLSGAWTPTARLTLELGGDAYALFSGVETFGPFQAGVSIGPRITVREPYGFETRLRWAHIFKRSLDPVYDYLGGNRDEAGIAEMWRDPKDRITVGYLFAREDIGVQKVLLNQIDFPIAPIGSFDPNSVYFIPYSYFGHEASLSGARDLPRDFFGTATLRYERREYDESAHIAAPNGTPSYYRPRRDDRYGVDVSMRHPIAYGFDVDLAYTLVVNRSTIDNTHATTPLDYDDKNYVKQVIQLDFSFVY